VDDVMTSGATLAACAEVCWQAGADAVDVVVLARVGREG
jgi:predicted amidophosphoribosyltransferase